MYDPDAEAAGMPQPYDYTNAYRQPQPQRSQQQQLPLPQQQQEGMNEVGDEAATAASAGGGFFSHSTSSSNRGQSPASTPSTSQNAAEERKKQLSTITPVTVKMLLESQPTSQASTFVWHDATFSQVSLVACVLGQSVRHIGMSYTLDDGTGSISGIQFHGEEEGSSAAGGAPAEDKQKQDFSMNGSTGAPQYVHIVGKLTQTANRSSPFMMNETERQINIVHLSPLDDHNRLTVHALDVALTYMQKTRGRIKAPPPQIIPATSEEKTEVSGGAAAGLTNLPPISAYSMPRTDGGRYHAGGGGFASSSAMPPSTSNSVAASFPMTPAAAATAAKRFRLYDFIQSHKDANAPMGIHVATVARSLNWSYTEAQSEIDALCADGRLYCVDSGMYKLTD